MDGLLACEHLLVMFNMEMLFMYLASKRRGEMEKVHGWEGAGALDMEHLSFLFTTPTLSGAAHPGGCGFLHQELVSRRGTDVRASLT